MNPCFVDVLLPLPLPRTYTYSVPPEWVEKVARGSRVVVPLGNKKSYTALVMEVHQSMPENCTVKEIRELLDETPLILPFQLQLWEWISRYYLCSLGEVYKAALPQGLKGEFKPKRELRIRLTSRCRDSFDYAQLTKRLSRTPRQLHLLNCYLQSSGFPSDTKELSKHHLLEEAGVSYAICRELIEKDIFEEYEAVVERLSPFVGERQAIHPLNVAQQKAYSQINQAFRQKNVCLLHGVTSSGKTEIYIHLILDALKRGEQVLYLLPEIALTGQIIARLRRVFGDSIGLYHSKFADSERVEIWKKQLSDEPYDIILGVRSSLFLPFQRLGLVIVDEEHENTYKQQEPAPRYHARSVAIVLASLFGAKTLLGTATPSMESYFNAVTGKYALVSLTQRYRSLQMPLIEVVDMKECRRRKEVTGFFSDPLREAMEKALNDHQQIILFQNRRGYAPLYECSLCGWVPRCKHCDVSLTYHKSSHKLICHYCGYSLPVPKKCPQCEESKFVQLGIGTEKIEDDLGKLFPQARLARMDMDTTRTRASYERIIEDFQQEKTDILIGTQMVSKGLDFDHVAVVGILSADSMLSYPDFRASERSFQLMAQVSGRAGRKYGRGRVILQTKIVDHPIISDVVSNDYASFYESQLKERMLFHYPPFNRLIYVYMKHANSSLLEEFSILFGNRMHELFKERVLGPELPPVARIQQLYIRKIILKIEHTISLSKVHETLLSLQEEFSSQKRYRSVYIYFDVDPL